MIVAAKDNPQELMKYAREFMVSYDIIKNTAILGRVPVTVFAAGGIATPADAAFMMNMGCDGIFVGSGVFKSEDAKNRASSIVLACSFHDDPEIVLEAQKMVIEKKAMDGISEASIIEKWDVRGSNI